MMIIMSFKEQINKIKENWVFIVLIIIVLAILFVAVLSLKPLAL